MSKLRINPHFLSGHFWFQAGLWLTPIILLLYVFQDNFLIGIDPQKVMCLPGGRFYLINTKERELWKGDTVAFYADNRMQPYFQPKTIMVKVLVGISGDSILVNKDGVHVNGKLVAKNLLLATKLKQNEKQFYRSEIVPPDSYFVIGLHPKSFDSRYWGFVREDQIIGRAREIPYITKIIEWLFSLISPANAGEDNLKAIMDIRNRTQIIQKDASSLVFPIKNPSANQMEKKVQDALSRFSVPGKDEIKSVLGVVAPDQVNSNIVKEAESLLRHQFTNTKTIINLPTRRYFILVSTSLKRERLREMFAAYSGREDVVFVFQGLLQGQKIEDFMAHIFSLVQNMDPQPNITLDPLIFREHTVSSVPVMIAIENGKTIGKVKGLVNVEWLEQKLSNYRNNPVTGTYGPVIAIAERNLMDIIEERMANIDWAYKKRQALGRFWSHQQFEILPPASKNDVRLIDMRIKVPTNVSTPDGDLIAHAGQIFNPLKLITFRQALIVFDASKERQVKWTKQTINQIFKDGLIPVLIATKLPKGDEWNTLQRIEKETSLPVHLLNGLLRERFEIRVTPTLITPHDQSHLKVEEIKLCTSCS